MTTLLLIRHALCDHVGREIAGRKSDIHLNAAGVAQATRLAEQLQGVHLDAIVASSLARARQTATPLAERHGLGVQIDDRLAEIDYGDWTGRTLDDLRQDQTWGRFNAIRSMTRVPNGELMLEVQSRAVSAVEAVRHAYPEGTCALISHGDVIRGLVAHFAGVPLDLFLRLEIAPASISAVSLYENWISVRCVNRTLGGLQDLLSS